MAEDPGANYRFKPLTEVAKRGEDGSLRCPACGGSQFKAKRSMGRKVTLGVGSLLLKQNQVACVTCGTVFLRSTKPWGSGIWGSGSHEQLQRLKVLIGALLVVGALGLVFGAFSR